MVTIMKKLLNLKYIALFAVLALFSACTEGEEYTPAQPSAETNAYRFAASSASNVVLALTDSVYQVVVERDDVTGEVTLPLNAKGDVKFFSVPASVTFAEGESKVALNIAIAPNMPAFENCYLEISIDESYVNPYATDNFSVLPITFLKEDYAPFANGVYTYCGLWGGGLSEQELEYSPILDVYRLQDVWGPSKVTFKITDPKTMAFEMTESVFNTGVLYAAGAPIVAYPVATEDCYNQYDADTNTFYFAFQFYVPAAGGGWAPMYEAYTITEYYE